MPSHPDISLPLLPGRAYHIYNRGNEKRRIFFREKNFTWFMDQYRKYTKGYLKTLAYCLLDNHFHLVIQLKDVDTILDCAISEGFTKIGIRFHRRYVHPWWNGLPDKRKQRGARTQDLTVLRELLNLPQQHPPPSPSTDLSKMSSGEKLSSHPSDLGEVSFPDQLASYIVSEKLRRWLLGYSKAVNRQENRTGSLFQKTFRRKWLSFPEDIRWTIAYVHHNPIHHGYTIGYNYPYSSYQKHLKRNSEYSVTQSSIFDTIADFIHFHKDYKLSKNFDLLDEN